jgi:hypothetical protein
MTIRLKLTIYWAAIIAAILLAAGVSTLLLFERQQWGDLDSALMEEADTAAASLIRLNPGAAVDAIVERLSEERDLGARRRVRIVSGDRVIADFGDRSSELPEIRTGEPVKEMRDGSGGNFRFAIFPFQLDGEAAILEDGVDATGIRRSIARPRTNLLITSILLYSAGLVIAGALPIGRVPLYAAYPEQPFQRRKSHGSIFTNITPGANSGSSAEAGRSHRKGSFR